MAGFCPISGSDFPVKHSGAMRPSRLKVAAGPLQREIAAIWAH
jgi:hypothetical protein